MRIVLTATLAVQCIFSICYSQQKRNHSVADNVAIDRVHFTLNSSSGTCNIKPTRHYGLVNIYEQSEFVHSPLEQDLKDSIQYVKFDMREKVSVDTEKKVSFRFFNSRSNDKETCNVYLSQRKPLIMDLNYGTGDANIDLSGMLVKKLLINTSSADVNVSCLSGECNKVEMDTFMVKVDMGELNVDNVNLTRSKAIIADVGFGNLNMDFSDSAVIQSNVYANVGAGKMQIILPEEEIPVIVYINDSPLCRVKLTKSFKSLDKYTYVNKAYDPNAKNLITFNIGVAMGQITFKQQ